MGKNSAIEWTDHTFNPWIGCAKVSVGCTNCYAETLMDTRFGRVQWGVNGTRSVTSPANWRQPLKWNREAGATGTRRRVFCASLADVFDDRPELEPWRIDLFKLIEATTHLDWLLLTKRPENVMRLISLAQEQAGVVVGPGVWLAWTGCWIGVSVENQEQADKRIPHLLDIPARGRFLSMEPLLGPVDLAEGGHGWLFVDELANGQRTGIHWVIVGGESGHNARPMHPEWARSIRDQCQAASVPFFFKQWGEYLEANEAINVLGDDHPIFRDCAPSKIERRAGGQLTTLDNLTMVRVGKHAAGRLLDGHEWNEFPLEIDA